MDTEIIKFFGIISAIFILIVNFSGKKPKVYNGDNNNQEGEIMIVRRVR